MRLKSQRQKIDSNKHNDRISKLPDVILGEILPLIPTAEAVATSILSKRWRYLWTLLKNLDFHYCDECGDKKDPDAFVKYVDGVFSKCTTQELNKFKLDGDWGGETHITRWIDEAISRNVQILEPYVPELPGSIFTCKSLTGLNAHVDLDELLSVPDSCHLPKLKGLKIFFSSQSIGFAQKLVSGCHAMEFFFMSAEIGSHETFVISLPLLNRLEMHTTAYGSSESEYTLVIDAPKLQFLLISTTGVPSYEIKNVASVVEATILVGVWKSEVTEKEICCILGLLNHLIEVKSLTLGSLTMRASPTLEVFNVDMDAELEEEDRKFHWIEPQNVPACLSSCIRVIKIDWIFQKDYKQELEMMEYLLGNGEVLQKFIFNGLNLLQELAFCKKLLTFPRASRYCVVEVL